MNEIRIGSWAELQERLFEDSWNEGLGRFRPSHAFRGIDDATYPLETSITRLGGDTEDLERHYCATSASTRNGTLPSRIPCGTGSR